MDNDFIELRNSVDNLMKQKAQNGIGTKVNKADIISQEEEEQLWSSGALGSDDPVTLIQTVFYQIGINFALRGGRDHRDLQAGHDSQFTFGKEIDGRRFMKYTENTSKCNTGGLKHYAMKRKTWTAYENLEDPNRCLVKLVEKYLSLCPSPRISPFYLTPLRKVLNSEVWYSKSQMGEQKLRTVVKEICERGKIGGYRTNHSLRATAASRLYHEGIDEQIIQELTGHRSVAVREYKRTSNELKRRVSDIISGNSSSASSSSKVSTVTVNQNHDDDDDDENSRKKTKCATIVVNVNI